MKSLEERKSERAKRKQVIERDAAASDAARGELQTAAEVAVAKQDKEAGVKSAPLAVKKSAAAPKSPFEQPVKKK